MKTELESIIDKHGLRVVMNTMIEICHEKAEHIRTNWQDAAASKVWARTAKQLTAVWARIDLEAPEPPPEGT